MARVSFTANIQRHVACPDADVTGATVAQVLAEYFSANPRARGYVLDEQGALRKHIVIFVDGRPIRDREQLADATPPASEVYVMQALSGG